MAAQVYKIAGGQPFILVKKEVGLGLQTQYTLQGGLYSGNLTPSIAGKIAK